MGETIPDRRDSEAPRFGWTALCEEDPAEDGWCAYHRSWDCEEGR